MALTVVGLVHSADFDRIQILPDGGVPVTEQVPGDLARRERAIAIAASGTYVDFQAAIKLLEENAGGELSGKNLEAWLALCFNRTDRKSLESAVRLLDAVSTTRALTDDELFMKAQLCAKIGSQEYWKEAKPLFKSLLKRHPNNVRISSVYAEHLIKRDEIVEAQPVAKTSHQVTRIRAGIHNEVRSGRVENALQILSGLQPKDSTTQEQQTRLLMLAAIAEEMGKYDSAFYDLSQAQLALLAKQVPRANLRLARSLGLYGDTEKAKAALQMCMQAGQQNVPPGASVGVALEILRKHRPKWNRALKNEVSQVGKWLDELVKESPNDARLQWRVTEYHDMQGNLERAVKEYRALLRSGSITNPIERGMLLNNYAYAAALHGDHEGLREVTRETKQLLGPIADVLDTEGFVCFSLGECEQAIQLFREAIAESSSPQKQFHLALALDKLDDPSASETYRAAKDAGLEVHDVPVALRDDFERLSQETN